MGLKIIFHWFGLMSSRIRYEYSQSWNAALCNNKPTTCGEKQQQSSRSEQRKGTPLRKRTNKDHFRCLITLGPEAALQYLTLYSFIIIIIIISSLPLLLLSSLLLLLLLLLLLSLLLFVLFLIFQLSPHF